MYRGAQSASASDRNRLVSIHLLVHCSLDQKPASIVVYFKLDPSIQMVWRFQSIAMSLFVLQVIVDLPPKVRSYTIRQANDRDVAMARTILLQQAMNPLSLSTKHLLVACNDEMEASTALGFGQIRPLDPHCSELASLFVLPEHRGQGVGSEIVRELMRRHGENESQSRICLLTLQSTTNYYQRFGFRLADHEDRKRLPKSIQVEFLLGRALSFVLGNDLVCMITGR